MARTSQRRFDETGRSRSYDFQKFIGLSGVRQWQPPDDLASAFLAAELPFRTVVASGRGEHAGGEGAGLNAQGVTDEVLAAAQQGDGAALRCVYEWLAPCVLGYLRAKGVADPEAVTAACAGVAICAHLAPNLIRADSWGYPILTREPTKKHDLRRASAAVAACPRRALFITSSP